MREGQDASFAGDGVPGDRGVAAVGAAADIDPDRPAGLPGDFPKVGARQGDQAEAIRQRVHPGDLGRAEEPLHHHGRQAVGRFRPWLGRWREVVHVKPR